MGFPSAKDLRWRFAKNWDPSSDKDVNIVSIDEATPTIRSADAPTKTADAPAKPSTAGQTKSAAGTASDSKNPPATGSAQAAADPASDAPSHAASSAHWDGFWPLTVADLLHPTDSNSPGVGSPVMDEGVRCLRRLARGDKLVGWNAAILWAQQDPASAVEVADVLRKLVVHPPKYWADGERASAVNKNGSLPAKPGAAKQLSDFKNAAEPADKASPGELGNRTARQTLSATTRCAAVEAWCLVLAASAADPVDGLAPAGRLLQQTDLPNEIRAELFRGIGRWVPPANIPRLENALREGEGKKRPPTIIRRAAIDACLIYAIWNQPAAPTETDRRKAGGKGPLNRVQSIWPKTVLNCRIDPDLEVRSAFIRWLGFARPEEAFELLKTQAEGANFEIRRTAFEGLAALHSDEAHAELRSQAAKAREALRAAAVQALAAWGLQDVTPYARDPSATVRRVVAYELGKQATLDSAVVLTELALDRSTEVQLAALRAVSDWPDKLAFPLLLHAMRDSAAKTRHEAAQDLSARTKVASSYRFDSPSEQREAAVTAIASQIGSSLTYLDQVLKREPRAVAEVNALRSAEVRAHLSALIENPADSPAATSAREWLAGIGTRDIPIVESYLQGATRASPAVIYHDVLPKVSPSYAALVDLESADVNIRRRGAKVLADRGRAATLSRPVLLRVREILAHEPDDLVWRLAMAAVGSDSTEECADLASLALQHQSAEVRRLGCEYLARHGQPSYAVELLALIEDRDRTVQLAAIRALGNCGNQVAVRGVTPIKGGRASPDLRSLLTSPDQEVQFAAAVSLCRLGAAEGMQELVRLSYHSNPRFREQAVREMGLTGQTRFVEHLVSLGWTEQHDQVRRAILESLDRLVPAENRPPAVGGMTAWDAKIKCWVQWLERRNGAPPQDVPAGAPLALRPGRES